MKKTVLTAISLLLALLLACGLAGCGKKAAADTAAPCPVYTADTELGEGEKCFTLEVKTDDSSVVFTIHTDKATVGEALSELGLIDGEQGQYGLYIKQVNGITADYDTDGTYWAFYVDGQYAMSGADMTDIVDGTAYMLAREK